MKFTDFTSFAITGFVASSYIHEKMLDKFGDYKFMFVLDGIPQDELAELERKIQIVKEMHRERMTQHDQVVADRYENRDKYIVRGHNTSIAFESLHPFHLCKQLKEISDQDLFMKEVHVLGNIQVMKNGNIFLSPSTITLIEDLTKLEELDEDLADCPAVYF